MAEHVDLVREAARLMRERAQAATPGPWSPDETGTVCAVADLRPGDGPGGKILPPDGPMEVAECYRNERRGERGHNAAHIASWHPAVALAIADLLYAVAQREEWYQSGEPSADDPEDDEMALALGIARAYLGREEATDG